MYEELYKAWKMEKESREVQALPKDFFTMLTQYVKKLREESRMLDEKTLRAKLLLRESKNVKRLAKELIQLRYDKTVRKIAAGEVVSKECLTDEEERLHGGILPLTESYEAFLKDLLRGRLSTVKKVEKPKQVLVRFLQAVPAIIGSDMKPLWTLQSRGRSNLAS